MSYTFTVWIRGTYIINICYYRAKRGTEEVNLVRKKNSMVNKNREAKIQAEEETQKETKDIESVRV